MAHKATQGFGGGIVDGVQNGLLCVVGSTADDIKVQEGYAVIGGKGYLRSTSDASTNYTPTTDEDYLVFLNAADAVDGQATPAALARITVATKVPPAVTNSAYLREPDSSVTNMIGSSSLQEGRSMVLAKADMRWKGVISVASLAAAATVDIVTRTLTTQVVIAGSVSDATDAANIAASLNADEAFHAAGYVAESSTADVIIWFPHAAGSSAPTFTSTPSANTATAATPVLEVYNLDNGYGQAVPQSKQRSA